MNKSLRDLKSDSSWNNKRTMRDHCVALVESLDCAIEATRQQVHHRTATQGFRLGAEGALRLKPEQLGCSKTHPGERRPSSETLLEMALQEKYAPFSGESGDGLPWACLVQRQLPIHEKQTAEGWGRVDLLGLDETGDPVIVELKKARNSDTPLHALLEASAYAIAVAANWRVLSRTLKEHYRGLPVVDTPKGTPLVILAPLEYWEDWTRWSATGSAVPRDTRDAFRSLCEAFAERSMPVSFASVEHDDWDERSPLVPEAVSVSLADVFSDRV